MADTRLQSLIEVNRQLEEMRVSQTQLAEAQNQRVEALETKIGGKFANLESMMMTLLTQTKNPVNPHQEDKPPPSAVPALGSQEAKPPERYESESGTPESRTRENINNST